MQGGAIPSKPQAPGEPFDMNLTARLLREASPYRLPLIAIAATCALTGITIVVQAHALSFSIARAFLGGWSLSALIPMILAFTFASLVRAGLTSVRILSGQRLANHVIASFRSRLVAHLFELGPVRVSAERSGELANTLAEGVEHLDAYFGGYVPQIVATASIPLILLAFAFPVEPLSALLLLLTAPFLLLLMYLIGSAADRLARRQFTALSRLSAQFIDSLRGLTALKLLGASRGRSDVIAESSEQLRERTLGVLRLAFLSAMSLEMLAMISTAIVAVQVGLRLLNGKLGFQQGLFVLLLAPEFYQPLRALGACFHAGTAGASAAERIFEILDTSPEKVPIQPGWRQHQIERTAVEFRNVHFSYPGRPKSVLRGASFSVPAGRTVALIGPSGEGKSTVAHLLLGFLRPTRGEIIVNGSPLAQHDLEAWRSNVSWIPQHPYLFNRSVEENIRLAKPSASNAELIEAARLAAADRFIRALPQGYDTVIGERGLRLSRGEAQRVALARAFLKDAPFVILDEPSAHLDPETEALIRTCMESLLAGRSALLIAHRLGSIPQPAEVIALFDGQVSENGIPTGASPGR